MKKPVAILCLVQFVDVLGVTEVLSAVPRMLASVSGPGAPPAARGIRAVAASAHSAASHSAAGHTAAASAVLTAYAMCFGGLLMVGARLGDRFGHRRALLAGISLFAAGSLAAARAGSVGVLIGGRSLQGAAAAISVPASLRLLIAATPDPADRRAAMSAWSAAGAIAGASGFLIGGAICQLTGWRAMFWVNLPLALALAIGVLSVTGARRDRSHRPLDLAGAALFSGGVAGVVLGAALLEPPGRSGLGLGAVGTGAGLLAAAALVERRARDPLLPAAALRHPALRVSAAAAFLNTATTSSAVAIATLELQRVHHLAPAAAGLRLLPVSLGGIAGAALATPALRRWSPPAVIALGLSIIGLADAGLIALHASGWLIAVPVGGAGAGIGVSSVAATGLGTNVDPELQATAAGAINTAAQLGTALGVAVLLLLVDATGHSPLPLHGALLGWAAAAVLALAGAAAIGPRLTPAVVRGRRPRSAAVQPDAPTPGG